MNERILEEIGLTKGEIKVYLTLLKIGETTTGKVIEQAQISSGKVYEILDKLMKKGLVGFILKDKTKYFSAASPNRILDFLQQKEKEIKEKQEDIKKELPLLLKLQNLEKKQYETKLFKGFKGVETAIFEALENLNSKDEVLAMGLITTKGKHYNLLWQKWHKERIKRKVKCKALFSDKTTEYYNNLKKLSYTEVKVLNGITPSAIDIIGKRVLILTYGKEPSVLSINNEEISQSFTSFFYNLWNIKK